jgi:hypothetical protein
MDKTTLPSQDNLQRCDLPFLTNQLGEGSISEGGPVVVVPL